MNNTNNTNHINEETKDENPFKSINTVTSSTHIDNGYSDIPETKTFYPTIDEFTNPLKYIQSIRDEGLKYGVIKIKPPKEWNPNFNLSFEDFKFQTKIQPIHILEKRVANGSLSSFTLTELRSNFLSNLRIFLGDSSIDNVIINKKIVYLYDLYKKVTLYGGYYKINNDKMWKNVGTELGVEYIGNSNVTASYIVKLCYEIYLLHYEQTHHFPSINSDINISSIDNYNNLLKTKSQQIRKIKTYSASNINDINTKLTCSVCGRFQTNMNNIFECMDCGNRFHSKCHEPEIINQYNVFRCSGCAIQKTAKFGYDSSSQIYSLGEFEKVAKQFKNNFINSLGRISLNDTEWENIFWSIVSNGCYPLSVEYGSEVPSKHEMTGFPMDDKEINGINYNSHEFNLMNIKNATGNILKHLDRDISGMTYPWIYVGMLFTAFGWHYEDHYAYSVNYNHYGNVKQWYSIPCLSADIAENGMKQFLAGTFEQFDLTTLVSPLELYKKYNVPIYKARQKPGEFIVTFPQAYHAGFNVGFNVAEAVNFCTADWLSFGLKCSERYRIFGRRQAFAHDELICNLCSKLEVLDLETLKWLFESFVFVYKAHYEFIRTMLNNNVTRGRMWEYDARQWIKDKISEDDEKDIADGTGRMKYDDKLLNDIKYEDAECFQCNHCLYIACVRCQCDPSMVACHKHFNEFCQCPMSQKWFEFRFTLSDFEEIFAKLITKVSAEYNNNNNNNIENENEYAAQELTTDFSAKNYEILCKSSDEFILRLTCDQTIENMKQKFNDRFGEILGGYTNELIKKLRSRFPKLSQQLMSQEELAHLCHACECVVWANFENESINENLFQVRRYFEILIDYQNVTNILLDAYKNYENVQSFYNQLQELQGEYDKISVLLQNQPRFPKKLKMSAIELALERAQNNEIKVELMQIIQTMPSILIFMKQQQEILQNALNGILTTTWSSEHSLIIQARTIVNFIPGNFADSYWRYLANNNILNTSTNTIHKNTCLVLPILKWLLSEFDRGILASIDCNAMNTIKQVIKKGKKLHFKINKFYKNTNKNCWMTQTELQFIINECNNLHLKVPFWEYMKQIYQKYNQWNCKTLLVLKSTNQNEKCSYEMIKNLVKQYKEYRIYNKNGDILRSYMLPVRKWISRAKTELNENNIQQCHQLLIEFDKYIQIITDFPKEYALLLQYCGVQKWMNNMENMIKNDNINQIELFIKKGKTFKIRRTNKMVEKLTQRLHKLQIFYKRCDELVHSIENKRKDIELIEYKKLVKMGESLGIDSGNHKLITVQEGIKQIEEWELYLKDKMAGLWRQDVSVTDKRKKKKRKYSELDGHGYSDEKSKYANGAYKRRKKKHDIGNGNGNGNAGVFWWKRVMEKQQNGYVLDVDYISERGQRKDERDIFSEMENMIEKSVIVPVKSEMENKMKNMFDEMKFCLRQCNELIDKGDALVSMDLIEIMKIKSSVEQNLHGTLVEFKIGLLVWKWYALYYLNDIKNDGNDNGNDNVNNGVNGWSLYRLVYEGNKLGLNDNDCGQWTEINVIYNNIKLFEIVLIGLVCKGNVDCEKLLLLNKKLNNNENMTMINSIKYCIGNNNEFIELLNTNIGQFKKISDRMEIFINFYNKNKNMTYNNLAILYGEMELLSDCINKTTIPNFDVISASYLSMNNIFGKLEELYFDRPHQNKCSLLQWINYQFLQFNIMYKNAGVIQMDKYRLNTVSHCYCICRFTYTQNMKENNEKIPEMIGCEECAEWYHGECIMLDDKDMRKFFNSKRSKFICPRCCYYEYNDFYKHFPSLHWKQMGLVKLNELENIINIENNNQICDCEIIDGLNRLISWIKIWQNDVNNFINLICKTHNVLSDFNEEEVFITEYLLNCGQISGIFTLELLILKILLRFIGTSSIYNNHNGVRQLNLYDLPIDIINQKILPKYKTKSKLLNDLIITTINDIKNSKIIFYNLFIDLFYIKSIGIHYITYMRRKKKGPMKVKLVIQRLNQILKMELKECKKLLNDKEMLEEKGEQFVNQQFTSDDTEWLKYVNESVSLKKTHKMECKTKWIERLNIYKNKLMQKYKHSRVRIQTVVTVFDLIHKLIDG